MTHRFAAVSLLAALLLGACGGGDATSPDEARRIMVAAFVNDGGLARPVAECVADRALAAHAPGELVNRDGRTTDAVNASVRAITATCVLELTPTTTTVVPVVTTPPSTTRPTVEPADYSAFCPAAVDVAVALAAGEALTAPGPAAVKAWFDGLTTRVQVAVISAPTAASQDTPLALSSELKRLATPLRAAGYDPTEFDAAIDTGFANLRAHADDLAEVLAGTCDVDVAADPAVAVAVRQLVRELEAVDTAATTVPTTTPPTAPVPDLDVAHGEAGIRVTVPGRWVGQEGGVAPDGTRFLIRATDAATVRATDFAGEGVRILARDGTTDWGALTDPLPHAQRCTLVSNDHYDDGVYVGRLVRWDDCPGAAGPIVVVGAADVAAQVAVAVEIRVTSIDSRAIDLVLNSFYV